MAAATGQVQGPSLVLVSGIGIGSGREQQTAKLEATGGGGLGIGGGHAADVTDSQQWGRAFGITGIRACPPSQKQVCQLHVAQPGSHMQGGLLLLLRPTIHFRPKPQEQFCTPGKGKTVVGREIGSPTPTSLLIRKMGIIANT